MNTRSSRFTALMSQAWRAEDDARRDLGGEVGHAVRARVEGHERLLGRQEVLLRRSHGGRIGKLDVVGRFDGLEGVALVALDRSHHFVGFHERRHERGKFSSVDDSIEHAHVLFSSGIPAQPSVREAPKNKKRAVARAKGSYAAGALGTCFTRRRCRSRARRIPGIGPWMDILVHDEAEIAADGARGRLGRVGGAHERAGTWPRRPRRRRPSSPRGRR